MPRQSCRQDYLFTSNTHKLHNSKSFEQNGVLLSVETGLQELVVLSYATVYLHPCGSLNNEKICCELVNIIWQYVKKLQVYGAGTLRI